MKKRVVFSILIVIIILSLIITFIIIDSSRLYSEKKIIKEYNNHLEEILALKDFFLAKISNNPEYTLNISKSIKSENANWSFEDKEIDALVNSLFRDTIFDQIIINSGEIEILSNKRTLDFCNGIAFSYYDSFALQDETTKYTLISHDIFYYESNMNR